MCGKFAFCSKRKFLASVYKPLNLTAYLVGYPAFSLTGYRIRCIPNHTWLCLQISTEGGTGSVILNS